MYPAFACFGFDSSKVDFKVLIVGEMDLSFAMDCSTYMREGWCVACIGMSIDIGISMSIGHWPCPWSLVLDFGIDIPIALTFTPTMRHQ